MNDLKLFVDRLSEHLGIALCLYDVGMPQHLAKVLNFDMIPEHIGGEGVTGKVGVDGRGYSCGITKGFECMVVVGIPDFWYLVVVLLQHFNSRRQ